MDKPRKSCDWQTDKAINLKAECTLPTYLRRQWHEIERVEFPEIGFLHPFAITTTWIINLG